MNESFDQDFCEFLEYHLCETFRNASEKSMRRLWCDGVAWKHCTRKAVNDKREIDTTAWIGQEGQNDYRLKIRLGKYALRRYAKGTDMTNCVPDSTSTEWIDIDIENELLTIQLK